MKYAIIGIMTGIVVGWSIGCFMWAPIVDFWEVRYTHYKTLYEYAYQGNVKRGYQTLCERSGHMGVWFVDECD